EEVAERVAEASGQRGQVDAIVDLHIDRLDPVKTGEDEERNGDSSTGGNDDGRAKSPQDTPGEQCVPNEVTEIARRRAKGPDRVLALEHRDRVRGVERHPEALVLAPPSVESVEL